MTIRNLLILLIIATGSASCTKAIIEENESIIDPIDKIIKYDPDIQTIIFNHCTTCHGGPAPSGGFTLTSYDDVRFYTESSTLIERMNNATNPMPPSGLISAQERQIIEKWVTDGFLEN